MRPARFHGPERRSLRRRARARSPHTGRPRSGRRGTRCGDVARGGRLRHISRRRGPVRGHREARKGRLAQGGRKHPQQEFLQVDTTNILFICGGAFAGLDKIISQRDKGTSIGFGANIKKTDDKKTGEWMKTLEPEDLLKYGLIPEFIGRLPMIATLEDLDEKSLIKILQEPKNSLIKQYQELFKLDGAKLNFKENAVKEIAQKAITKKTGARGLRSILENILLKTMYDLPSQDNVEEVIVDASAAKGLSQPIIVHSKNNTKTKMDKTSAA